MKDILAVIDPTEPLAGGIHYALSLARAYEARVSALVAELADTDLWSQPAAVEGDEARLSERLTPAERLARTAVLSAAERVDVPCEIISLGSGLTLRK